MARVELDLNVGAGRVGRRSRSTAATLPATPVDLGQWTETGIRGELSGTTTEVRRSWPMRGILIGTAASAVLGLFFALIYNLLGVPLAAGVLYPVFGILLSPMLAAAAKSLSSVSVITNALRLRKVSLA